MPEDYYCNMHVHDEYSILDGLGSGAKYAVRAKELEQRYIAITNHGNIDGVIKFQQACEEAGVKSIIGCEGYIVLDAKDKQKGEKRSHIVLFVKNEKGWVNIKKILTYANIEGFYYKPRFDPEFLLAHCDGLAISTACSSSFLFQDWGEDLLTELSDRTEVFLEIIPLVGFEPQKAVNEYKVLLHRKYGLPLLATNDCHYVLQGEDDIHEALLCIGGKYKLSDTNRRRFEAKNLYLKSGREMLTALRQQGVVDSKLSEQAVYNSISLAELCSNFRIEKISVYLPNVPGIPSGEEDNFIRKLCAEKLKLYFGERDNFSDYQSRYEEEINSISGQGFIRYFLIVWELISWCRNNDIMVGPGRGSSGGSLVSYLLGITQVDPIKFGLLFSRFISPARIDIPDIDMDFEDIHRPRIRKHLEDLYGQECVAGISTFSKLKGRSAIRDVARVYDVPMIDSDKAAKAVVVRCLDGDSMVYTVEGPKAIRDLAGSSGFRVSCHGHGSRRETREVEQVFVNPDMDMFEMTLESGKKIICSAEHKFWSKYSHIYNGKIYSNVGWRKLRDLKPTDKILTYEHCEVYSHCKQCGKIIYRKRNRDRSFCSLSCLAIYKNLHDNPY